MLTEHLLCARNCAQLWELKKEAWAHILCVASYLQMGQFLRAETVLRNFVFLFVKTRSFDQASISQMGF